MIKNDISKLLFFKPEEGSILAGISEAEELISGGACASSGSQVLSLINRLISLSLNLGIDGNLWQNYIVYFLLTDENAYTLSRERIKAGKDSFSGLALSDFSVMRSIMNYDFSGLENAVNPGMAKELLNFSSETPASKFAGRGGSIVKETLEKLKNVSSDEEFKAVFDAHYEKRGCGVYAFTDAFSIGEDEKGETILKAIKATDKVTFEDLIGYDDQKAELIRNTEAFLEGRPANNVLLYGDSGSGKSTSIKAMLNEYSDNGLRIIEIYKHQFKQISSVLAMVKNRNYRFILYIDDLSFEDFEIEYKYLKAVIEGDLEVRPDNVLIYATSNRRHLIKETWKDRTDMEHDGDIHRSDTIEEKTSLSTRFGVNIYFASPTPQMYHQIVETLAERAGIDMDKQQMLVKSDAWSIRHGGYTCRTARQFVDYLASEKR
ncbi:MAG: ATP-binding protein [Clostridia bacterium]|nr:ATP-binding protein [Clostridia bacterium]